MLLPQHLSLLPLRVQLLSPRPQRPVPRSPAATPAPPALNPVIEAVRKKLADGSLARRDNLSEDVAAAISYYDTRTEPLWITTAATRIRQSRRLELRNGR